MEKYQEFLKRRNIVRIVFLENGLGGRIGDEFKESEDRSNSGAFPGPRQKAMSICTGFIVMSVKHEGEWGRYLRGWGHRC